MKDTDQMKIKTSKLLGENEHEFTTEVVYQSGSSFFYELRNGGKRGAWQGSGPGGGPQHLTMDEALAKLASWGIEEVEIGGVAS